MTHSSDKDSEFTLFEDEDRVLQYAETILGGLDETTRLIRSLTLAYKRAVREQKRMVRLSDRNQEELMAVKARLEGEVRARAELVEQFRILATTDALTETYLRGHFLELCNHELKARSRSQDPLTMALLDVDKFKEVNDTYGHAAGDQALKTLCNVLKDNLRQSDIIARWGGEEFAIMMPRTANDDAAALAERLRQNIADKTISDGRCSFAITASFGLCTLEGPNPVDSSRKDPIDTLFHHADRALYQAKTNGRNAVVSSVYSAGGTAGKQAAMAQARR
ncbi:GGDEF domain-containing protein [Roseibium sediminicola]|uniref:diguanylate cyclase n=1 Tax=Roseibium sediminicola TaxID=2933272 RepID=A0ABT0GSS9_9HYPH|nr:GGDEF domain-containing protein [Roseibium sp. CAU 1639]MCK7611905.1 GGDEF domain-containing protein [Roseibium sp. CAU 1639]